MSLSMKRNHLLQFNDVTGYVDDQVYMLICYSMHLEYFSNLVISVNLIGHYLIPFIISRISFILECFLDVERVWDADFKKDDCAYLEMNLLNYIS